MEGRLESDSNPGPLRSWFSPVGTTLNQSNCKAKACWNRLDGTRTGSWSFCEFVIVMYAWKIVVLSALFGFCCCCFCFVFLSLFLNFTCFFVQLQRPTKKTHVFHERSELVLPSKLTCPSESRSASFIISSISSSVMSSPKFVNTWKQHLAQNQGNS